MALIRWLQELMPGPGWAAFWILTTKLYSETVALVLFPLVYWLAGRAFARLFATLFLAQLWLNTGLKALLALPRPPAEVVIAPIDAGGPYGFPSGHAQGAAVTYGALAAAVQRRWFTALASLAIFLVGISRVYLGVHYPADVLGGWAVGLAFLWAGWRGAPWLAERLAAVPWVGRLALAVLVPAAMAALYGALPATAALGLQDIFAAMGALAGFWAGSLAEERWVGYDPHTPWPQRLLRVVLGAAALLALRVALKVALPAGLWFTFLRYGLLAGAATCLLPWVYQRLPGGRR